MGDIPAELHGASVDATDGPPPEVLAAIDVGTNSFHLVVARVDGRSMEVVTRQKESVRLGHGPGEMKRLSPAAMDRGIACLIRQRDVADGHGAPVRAVATSAVREALNRHEFLHRARTEAGVDIEVVSGVEEARLIHLGMVQSVAVGDESHLLCDIGGGSTELVVGRGEEILDARSFKLGAIRLTDRFFADGDLDKTSVKACRRYVAATLAAFVSEHSRAAPPRRLVASSGTAATICRVALALQERDEPLTLTGHVAGRAEVDAAVEAICRAWLAGDRTAVPGLDAGRADIILGGALILEQVVESFGFDEVTYSDGALREGVLLDTWRRRHGAGGHHLSDIRRRSVEHLQRACDADVEHSATVAAHALAIFDATTDLHGLDDAARELLEAGALLANVGLVVAHAGHHRHSYYVIRHCEHLTGFTDREVELIALVARYHRKSPPKAKHEAWAALDEADRSLVCTLAGVLRVAVGLDRRHAATVERIAVEIKPKTVVITAAGVGGADVSLEVYEASERAGLLAEVLGRRVRVEAVGG